MSFTVATYNVLADAYIRRELYPNTSAAVLEPVARRRALLAHLVELDADVFCLQEVERAAFTEISDRLAPLGYAGHYSQKAGGKPDGCAIFFRKALFTFGEIVRCVYTDDRTKRRPSGHVAQLVSLEQGASRLGVVNTHLQWDPPEIPRSEKSGYRQVEQLLQALDREIPSCTAWIICGDLNATPDSELVQLILGAGFTCTHADYPNPYTFSADGKARTIDYLFHSVELRAEPLPLAAVDARTALPGPDQPSDHVAVTARFTWSEENTR